MKKNKRIAALVRNPLPTVHYVAPYLKQPTNPVTINLIGAGGTGSHVASVLGSLQLALLALDHPGLHVTVFDDDTVSPFNVGRQGFFESEVGLNKAVALVTRINRCFGTQWVAVKRRWNTVHEAFLKKYIQANISISCVDTVEARFDIARLLKQVAPGHGPQNGLYWIDFGNARYTGQVILSTLQTIKQPASESYLGIGKLAYMTEEYKDLLSNTTDRDEPSCSMADALQKQGLYINRALAASGGMLIENLFRSVRLESKGFFLNIAEYRQQPIPIA